ncbi:MAG: hypothetical protein AAGF56_06980 [Pseudomonadota bacterium]
MSNLNEAIPQDMSDQTAVASFGAPLMSYTIKRSGGRPLRFEGSELMMAMSYSAASPYWYEINLYRTKDQEFVTAVRLFYQAEDKQDTVRAWTTSSVDAAIAKLARYDAGYDVMVDHSMLDAGGPPAALASRAVMLQARLAEARQHYKSLVGEFLYDLETGS